MIIVTIRRNDAGQYSGFEVKGHAEFAEEGNDIICAAVSMLSINTANAIEELTGTKIKVTQSDRNKGCLKVVFPEGSNEKSELLMKSYEMGIRGVMDAYNQNETYVSVKIAKV